MTWRRQSKGSGGQSNHVKTTAEGNSAYLNSGRTSRGGRAHDDESCVLLHVEGARVEEAEPSSSRQKAEQEVSFPPHRNERMWTHANACPKK